MHSPFLAGASALAVIVLPAHAHAKSSEMDESAAILVVGQTEAPIEIAPRGLSVSLGDEQMEAVNAVNAEDLMKYAPNFFVRKRYAGDSNGVPGFRGTHSTQSARTLVMVDGFVVSNFLGNSFGFAPKWGVVGPDEVKQFDIVYGPYSSRYIGNSMGGIVNITTRDPRDMGAYATVQSFVQPYRQFGTDDDYYGVSGQAGIAWRQKNGPFSLRLTGRFFRNDGHPQTFYGLSPAAGSSATPVTGAIVDPKQTQAAAPGTVTNPIFAAQSPARITQEQAKLKVGYDDGFVAGQFLFAFWHNQDRQTRPDCYLRDASGNRLCEGRVSIGNQMFVASGVNFSKTLRDEFLAGLKLAAPLSDDMTARIAVSTYQIARSDGFISDGYVKGLNHDSGVLTAQGPTGWWTGDLMIENKTDRREFAVGLTANAYRTDQTRYTLSDWTSKTDRSFFNRTFGKTRQLSAWAETRFLLDPLTLTLGIRYDNWRAYDGGLTRLGEDGLAGQQLSNRYASRKEDAVSPSLSFEYRLNDATQLQLSLATATRFPTVGELFQGSLNGDGTFNADSFDPGLKPEKSRDANLLLAHDFGRVKLTGSAFYQRVRNTIFSFTGFNRNGVVTSNFKNIDITRQYGLELIAETHNWPLPGMNIDANVAHIDSKTIRNASAPAAGGVQFPRIPKWRVNANLRYAITQRLQGSLGMRYASRPNTDLFGLQRGDTFGFTSEMFALDARLNWNMTERLRLSAGVDNITNDRAWVFHPYPQRSFLVEAGWRL